MRKCNNLQDSINEKLKHFQDIVAVTTFDDIKKMLHELKQSRPMSLNLDVNVLVKQMSYLVKRCFNSHAITLNDFCDQIRGLKNKGHKIFDFC